MDDDDRTQALARQRDEIIAALEELRGEATVSEGRDLYVDGIEDAIKRIRQNFRSP